LVLIKDFGGVGILPALFWLRTPHPMYWNPKCSFHILLQ
jgi:hypothetical protein